MIVSGIGNFNAGLNIEQEIRNKEVQGRDGVKNKRQENR